MKDIKVRSAGSNKRGEINSVIEGGLDRRGMNRGRNGVQLREEGE
nr:hypothetical protein [Staphylococcus epidermidis]